MHLGVHVKRAIALGCAALCAGLVTVWFAPDHAYDAYVARVQAQGAPYDLVIRNGRVIDGTGSTWYRADIGVRGDTIATIAPSITDNAARVIDAGGQIVSPGFIDIHNHGRENIFELPTADNYIRQGVTTIIEGPDGGSAIPLGAFFTKLDALQKSINIGSFVGQGSVREAVLGRANRRPTPAELDKMRAIVEESMKAGALGMSTGLFYVPGAFTPIEEVIELAKVAAKYGGIHISHMRDEAFGVIDSVKETIRIGEEGGLPTQVTHHKIVGPANYGKSVETLKLLEAARARGVDATSDQYPYTASSNAFVASMVPQWAQEGGREQMLTRLKNPSSRKEIAAETVRIIRTYQDTGKVPNVVNLARQTPATHMLVVRHRDKPGVLAHVFDHLRRADLNVQETENIIFDGAHAAVARINLDGAPSSRALDAMQSGNADILDLQLVKL